MQKHEKKSGGNRKNAGRPPINLEKTVTVSFRVPISKHEIAKKRAKELKDEMCA